MQRIKRVEWAVGELRRTETLLPWKIRKLSEVRGWLRALARAECAKGGVVAARDDNYISVRFERQGGNRYVDFYRVTEFRSRGNAKPRREPQPAVGQITPASRQGGSGGPVGPSATSPSADGRAAEAWRTGPPDGPPTPCTERVA